MSFDEHITRTARNQVSFSTTGARPGACARGTGSPARGTAAGRGTLRAICVLFVKTVGGGRDVGSGHPAAGSGASAGGVSARSPAATNSHCEQSGYPGHALATSSCANSQHEQTGCPRRRTPRPTSLAPALACTTPARTRCGPRKAGAALPTLGTPESRFRYTRSRRAPPPCARPTGADGGAPWPEYR